MVSARGDTRVHKSSVLAWCQLGVILGLISHLCWRGKCFYLSGLLVDTTLNDQVALSDKNTGEQENN